MELYPTPGNPLPANAVYVAVRTRDNLVLRAMRALVPEAKGTVIILGGRGDFLERYFETMIDLMSRGFSVAALDIRGQGGSPRLLKNRYRGHCHSFADYNEDMRAFMTEAVLPHCPPPFYALGHSTGGNVLLQVLRERRWFAKAVVVAPLIGLVYGPWPLPIVKLLVFLAANLGLGWMFLPGQGRWPLGRKDFDGNPLSSDRRRWNRDSAILEAAPHLGLGAPTFSWLRAAMKSTAALKRLNPRKPLRTPVMIVAAGLERVVDSEAIRYFAERMPGVSLVVIPGAMHEILTENDAIRTQFFAAFDTFIGSDKSP